MHAASYSTSRDKICALCDNELVMAECGSPTWPTRVLQARERVTEYHCQMQALHRFSTVYGESKSRPIDCVHLHSPYPRPSLVQDILMQQDPSKDGLCLRTHILTPAVSLMCMNHCTLASACPSCWSPRPNVPRPRTRSGRLDMAWGLGYPASPSCIRAPVCCTP